MPRVVDRSAKREQMLQAALAVFAERGYHGATMQSVAERAGVSKGSIYEYFPSKERLLLDTADTLLTAIVDKSVAVLEQSSTGSLRDAVEAFVRSLLQSVEEWNEVCMTVLQVWAELGASKDGPVRSLMAEIYLRSVERIQHVFDEAVAGGKVRGFSTRATACGLLAALDGMILQAIFVPQEFHANLVDGSFVDWCVTIVPSELPGAVR